MAPDSILIRASAQFQKECKLIPQNKNAPTRPFPLTWDVDVLAHGRRQLLAMFSEEETLFTLLVPMRDGDLTSCLNAFRIRLGQNAPGVRTAAEFEFSKRVNRRVIGSQSELRYLAHEMLKDVDRTISNQLIEFLERQLNAVPISYPSKTCPSAAFAERIRLLAQNN